MYNSKYSNDYQVMTEGYVMNGDFRQHPYSDLIFGGQLDGYGGVTFWATLGGLVSNLYPSVAVGAISLDQMVAQIVGTISALNAGGIDPSTGGPSPFGPGYMQSILPLELRLSLIHI